MEKPTYSPMEVAFAIDLESGSGHNQSFPGREPDETTGDILAIGAAVVAFDNETKKFVVLGKFLERLRRDGLSIISDDCFKHFWNKDEDAKKAFPNLLVSVHDKERSRDFLEKRAVTNLIAFATEWRNQCKTEKYKFKCVTDNGAFDFGGIDYMILRHLPNTKTTMFLGGGYNGGARCVTSKEQTLLGLVDNHWMRRAKDTDWDITERVRLLYGIPEFPVKHDHMPSNDAVVTACRYLMVKAIEDGIFTLREDLVEPVPEGATKPFYPAKKKRKEML